MSPELEYYRALDARDSARFALRSGLPGRLIYFRASMRRAIAKWKNFKEMVRTAK